MANQSSKKWIPSLDIMEKRKDTSSIRPNQITSTTSSSEVSLKFDHQPEHTGSNGDTDNEEIPATSYPADDSDDRVSLEEMSEEKGQSTEKTSDKEVSIEERRSEKKRLKRNEDGLQQREGKSSKKLKTDEGPDEEKPGKVSDETDHSDIVFSVMDFTDEFYDSSISNKANSMWYIEEADVPPTVEISTVEISASENEEENDNDSPYASDSEISRSVTDNTNDITNRTNYTADTNNNQPETPPFIMLNVGLEYSIIPVNEEASQADDIHVVTFWNGDNDHISTSTDVSSEEPEIGGIPRSPRSGLTFSIGQPVSVASMDQSKSNCVC